MSGTARQKDAPFASLDDEVWECEGDPPLTEFETLRLIEDQAEIAPSGLSYVNQLALIEVSDEVRNHFASLKSGLFNWIELYISSDGKECLLKGEARKVEPFQLQTVPLPLEYPRFIFYAYEHRRTGHNIITNLLIFYCPDAAPVRLRMLHSTTKAAVLAAAKEAGLDVAKRIEVRASIEVTESIILEELYPTLKASSAAAVIGGSGPSFPKPAAPGRGPKRLIS
eukprot:CAMPEP_0184372880 /NCGR_PEP_ID=MMETSP1089-20130417/164180_1 /TAXON_ID=38269 ORGANISM="Gloeochaete wittrockiana, Strain SAG46.84" /NCGR_SAMPLE_ID=MMETSP1089 /ASSEMBLY_ACC=CAM_ASM_000445 /LENGTH=224 /DNA_ID=CAMNT_0026715755 /DNA_START=85 /DNA_END=759 /DNA_ORIENTATION=-